MMYWRGTKQATQMEQRLARAPRANCNSSIVVVASHSQINRIHKVSWTQMKEKKRIRVKKQKRKKGKNIIKNFNWNSCGILCVSVYAAHWIKQSILRLENTEFYQLFWCDSHVSFVLAESKVKEMGIVSIFQETKVEIEWHGLHRKISCYFERSKHTRFRSTLNWMEFELSVGSVCVESFHWKRHSSWKSQN